MSDQVHSHSSRRALRPLTPVVVAGAIAAFFSVVFAADRNALWTIVHDRCVPNETSHHDPAPCETVDLNGGEQQGYAILKDRNGATQFLLIPTRKLAGMESPELTAPDLPNYWEPAWQARRFVEARAKRTLSWDMIGLAINSSLGRTQDQLHIHIDCVRADVRQALSENAEDIGPVWAELPFDLQGRRYLALRLDAGQLASEDPFKLLARKFPNAQEMAAETLVVIGSTLGGGRNSFVVLADRGQPDKNVYAHGEDLLDHSCAVAGPQ
jgi:CDP-diacylglycerol pyrophosphatase